MSREPKATILFQTRLLRSAGGSLSPAAAAGKFGVSLDSLRERIADGRVLGLMLGTEPAIPKAQFALAGDKEAMAAHAAVVSLFDETGAGRWSALQFLTETDPNLRETPLEALRKGRAAETIAAANAYLGVEGNPLPRPEIHSGPPAKEDR